LVESVEKELLSCEEKKKQQAKSQKKSEGKQRAKTLKIKRKSHKRLEIYEKAV
jgi:hypothetical protein